MKGSAILPVFVAGVTPFVVLVLLVTGAGLGLVAWKPPILWSDTFGTPPASNSATTVASGPSGVYVEGYLNFSGVGDGAGTLFLNKYTPDGEVVWARTIASANNTYIDGMSLGPDGLYFTGMNQNDVGFVTKYDLSGSQIWMTQLETGAGGEAIAASSAGVFLAGQANPLTNQSFTGGVMFVREYDPGGTVVWTNEFSNASGHIYNLYAASTGVFVVGRVQGSLSGQTAIGGFDAFLVKYDLLGNLVWTRQFGTPGDDAGYGVSADATGVYVTGNTMAGSTSSSGFLRKYDFNGNLDWTTQIGAPDGTAVGDSAIVLDSSGVYVSISTSFNEFLIHYDLQGHQVWNFQMQSAKEGLYGGTAYRLATGSAVVYVAGSVPTSQTRVYGGSAALVAAVSPSPSLVFFGLIPPLSFVVVGVLAAAAGSGLFFFRRIRRRRMRPSRVGPSEHSLPARD